MTPARAKSVRNPWIKFYPQDYLGDEGLSLCSLAAQGLWIRMLCVMSRSVRPGWLVTGQGRPYRVEDVARLGDVDSSTAEALLAELEEFCVFSRGGRDRAIYSRRMVHEALVSGERRAAVAKRRDRSGPSGQTTVSEVGLPGDGPALARDVPEPDAERCPEPIPTSQSETPSDFNAFEGLYLQNGYKRPTNVLTKPLLQIPEARIQKKEDSPEPQNPDSTRHTESQKIILPDSVPARPSAEPEPEPEPPGPDLAPPPFTNRTGPAHSAQLPLPGPDQIEQLAQLLAYRHHGRANPLAHARDQARGFCREARADIDFVMAVVGQAHAKFPHPCLEPSEPDDYAAADLARARHQNGVAHADSQFWNAVLPVLIKAEHDRRNAFIAKISQVEIMPRLGDPPQRWAGLAEGHVTLDACGRPVPTVSGHDIRACAQDCAAAFGQTDPAFRASRWQPLAEWLYDGIAPDTITGAIRDAARAKTESLARQGRPGPAPQHPAYYDGPVRAAHLALGRAVAA